MKKKIYVCSPCKGDVKTNIENARLYSKYVASQGFIPFTPHIYFTEFLNDNIPEERQVGLKLALEWLFQCHELWCFGEAVSEGMKNEIEIAKKIGMKVVNITIDSVENFFKRPKLMKSIEQNILNKINESFSDE
jgi:hypothetical protein